VGYRVATCGVRARVGIVVTVGGDEGNVGQRDAKSANAVDVHRCGLQSELRGYRALPGYFPVTLIALYVRTRFYMGVHPRVHVSIEAK